MERDEFPGPPYFDYEPRLRVLAEVRTAEPELRQIGASGNEAVLFRRFATASFELDGQELSLDLYWLEGYGGGFFVSFATRRRRETYGGGRYLLDTVKGADLGSDGERSSSTSTSPTTRRAPTTRMGLSARPAANTLAPAIRGGERFGK